MKGKKQTEQKSITAFCIAHNFRPYAPPTVKKQIARSPFEKLNGFQYHDNWLQNIQEHDCKYARAIGAVDAIKQYCKALGVKKGSGISFAEKMYKSETE